MRIVQLRRLTFLNGLCGSLNEVICQCYSWYRIYRGKNFVRLCNEYDIVGSSPLIFDGKRTFAPPPPFSVSGCTIQVYIFDSVKN